MLAVGKKRSNIGRSSTNKKHGVIIQRQHQPVTLAERHMNQDFFGLFDALAVCEMVSSSI